MVNKTNDIAIELTSVTKKYPLHSGKFDAFLYALPLTNKIFGSRWDSLQYSTALDEVNLTIGRGEKVGIIGRNGAGKSTLLNLVIGYADASQGQVNCRGNIQAMMQGGLGFHEEISGSQNVKNSLMLNGLNKEEMESAYKDVIDFVELAEFIKYPFKTYSLGMRARLEFATATAIFPEILVIDEVLGAGDGYFSQKSAKRMRSLVENTTLLLVSHSMGPNKGIL